MSGFSVESLSKRLSELNSSQQSIQSLSLWLIHHRKHHEKIVSTWLKELRSAKVSRKLSLVYLANDVIQNSRKKGPEFSNEFSKALRPAYENVARECDVKTLGSLRRVLDVWEERRIYDKNLIAKLKEILNANKESASQNASKPSSSKTNGSSSDHQFKVPSSKPPSSSGQRSQEKRKSSGSSGSSEKKAKISAESENDRSDSSATNNHINGAHVDADELIKALQELENSASCDAKVREKIAKLPPEVSDISLLDKLNGREAAKKLQKQVQEATTLLVHYNNRLSQELEERKRISQMLAQFTEIQRESFSETQELLKEYKEKLAKVQQVKQELKSHLENLPDLSRLPSMTADLGPLPAASDLFSGQRRSSHSSTAEYESVK